MLKLASKFAMDILPSVIATVVGAYIVNHYINNRTPAATPAAAVSTAEPKKAFSKADLKPVERSADLGKIHEPGVRAKGISEKSIAEKSAAEKASVEKPSVEKASLEKADHPAETASIPPVTPAEGRRHPVEKREKAASKPNPTPPAEPVVAAPATAPVEATPDANDLARAAIERLRGTDPAPRVQEAARAPEPVKPAEPPRAVAAPSAQGPASVPVATAPSLQPLPPPILVSTPPAADAKPPVVRNDDPNRPTPPADIPDPHPPLDLRADAAADQPAPKRPLADVFSAAKSMFNSVLPKPQQQ